MPKKELKNPLPQEKTSQRIGRYARETLDSNKPLTWDMETIPGDDFGYDLVVQIITGESAKYIFRIQLKGSQRGKLSADKKYFSVPLKASTLNYYINNPEPTMLAFSDIPEKENPKVDPRECKAYYVWLSEEIRRLLGNKKAFTDDQTTHNVRVPIANLVTRDLDVIPFLDEYLKINQACQGFGYAVSVAIKNTNLQTKVETIDKISSNILEKGEGFLNLLKEDGVSPWPEAKEGTVAKKLHETLEFLRRGDNISTNTTLVAISKEINRSGSNHEKAEFNYLKGKLSQLEKRGEDSIKFLGIAADQYPEEDKYYVAWVEAQFSEAHERDQESEYDQFLTLLKDKNSLTALKVKAKILTTLYRFDDALDVVKATPKKDKGFIECLIQIFKRDWKAVIASTSEILANEELTEKEKIIFSVFNARAHFSLAVNNDELLESGEPLPIYGPSTINHKQLHLAWEKILATLKLLKAAGWPEIVDYFVDILAFASVFLSRQERIIDDLKSMARARHNFLHVNKALQLVALSSKDYLTALEAVNNLPETPETIIGKLLLFHEMGDINQLSALARKELLTLPDDLNSYPICLSIASLACDELLFKEDEEKFLAKLASKAKWAGELAIHHCVKTISNNPLEKEKAIQKLEEEYKKTNFCNLIGYHLIKFLNSTNESDARKIIEIAARVEEKENLAQNDYQIICQAYFTLNKFDELNQFVETLIGKYGPTGNFKAIKALMLEKKGETGEALEILEELIANSVFDPLAINTYINITLRCGFYEKTIASLETLLAKEEKNTQKLETLRLLYNLEYHKDQTSKRLFDISYRFGELCDSKVESEEALFLQMTTTSTLFSKESIPAAKSATIKTRFENFFKNFPKSKLFQKVDLPSDGDWDKFKEILDRIRGNTPQKERAFQKLVNLLHSGEIAAPFCTRPQKIFRDVLNVPQLWEVSKNSRADAIELHLTIQHGDWKSQDLTRGPDRPPLIDLISLILLYDLGILEFLFQAFEKIAVSKRTLLELQNFRHPLSGVPNRISLINIRSILQRNLAQLLQPGEPTPELGESGNEFLGTSNEELKELAQTGEYTLYTDDSIFKAYIDLPEKAPTPICTLDFLQLLDEKELMPIKNISDKIAQLCKWNVGGTIFTARYFLGSLPDTILDLRSTKEILNCVGQSDTFQVLSDIAWGGQKEYKESLNHFSKINAYLIQLGARKHPEAIAAIWACWLLKVRFRTKPNLNIEENIAISLICTARHIKSDRIEDLKLLWGSFTKLIELEFQKLDEKKERALISMVGKVLGGFIGSGLDQDSGNILFNRLKNGLKEGTAESELFSIGYVQSRGASIHEELRNNIELGPLQ